MYRVSFIFRRCAEAVLLFVFLSPFSVFAVVNTTVVSQIVSVSPCGDNSGYAISFQSTSTPLAVFVNGVSASYPAGALPQAGQNVFGTLQGTTTCNGISLRMLGFLSSAVPSSLISSSPTTTPAANPSNTSGQNILNSLLPTFSSLIQQIQHYFTPQQLTQNMQTAPPPGSGGSGGGAPSVTPTFGGTVLPVPTPPTYCDDGSIFAYIGPPVAKPVLCYPGTGCYRYLHGPPLIVGQNALGTLVPTLTTCFVGAAPIGAGFPVIISGTSLGPGVSTPPAKPKPAAPSNARACLAGSYDLGNSAGKAQAEAVVRKQLALQNITVNKGMCPVGVSFQSASGGCTDVSGLQCTSLSDLQNLSGQCGAFELTGGNESGHATHSAGNAVDIQSNGSAFNNSISQCLETKFPACGTSGSGCSCTHSTGKEFCDPNTGTTFWQEYPGASAHNTGAHWHVCFGGKGC